MLALWLAAGLLAAPSVAPPAASGGKQLTYEQARREYDRKRGQDSFDALVDSLEPERSSKAVKRKTKPVSVFAPLEPVAPLVLPEAQPLPLDDLGAANDASFRAEMVAGEILLAAMNPPAVPADDAEAIAMLMILLES